MKLLTKKLALALLLVSVAVASASPVGAAGRGQSTTTPLAGPWYTPQELKALIAYSKASFAQKKAILAGAEPSSIPTENGLLVYESQTGKRAQLFTTKPDGSGAHQLTHFADSDAVWAEWSPSGSQITFERDVYTGVRVNHAAIYTMNADGSGLRSLTQRGLNGRPSWSPGGTLIAFSTLQYGKQATVSVMAANGSRVRKVMSTPLPAKGRGQGLDSPTFSPDGKRIAFVWIKKSGSAIFTMKASGGGLKQVTPWQKTGLADKIDWSPDGSRIAFSSPEFGERRGGISSNVFTVRPNGSGLVKLTNSAGGKINNGLDSWSPDGKKIAFVSNRTGKYEIYVMNANGSSVTQVTRGPEAHHASWGTHP
jgi:Tol biopolymer transport system component